MPLGLSKKRSIQEAAKILKTTVSKIKRVLRIAKTAPAELEHIKWGSGCQQQTKELTAEQRDWAKDPQRLREQVGLSLRARKEAFNAEFNEHISVPKFRCFYKQVGITQQKMCSRLGGKKLPSQQR